MESNYTNCLFQIDKDNGVITVTSHGVRLLRITHLPDPIPPGISIDIVALPALTSYMPIEDIEPVTAGEIPGSKSGEIDPSVRTLYLDSARAARGWGSAPTEVPDEKRRNGIQMRPLRREA